MESRFSTQRPALRGHRGRLRSQCGHRESCQVPWYFQKHQGFGGAQALSTLMIIHFFFKGGHGRPFVFLIKNID